MLEKILAGGGAVAAVGASTCCVLPLSLGAVGAGGAWLSRLSVLAPYGFALKVAAILLLGAGFWMVYGRRPPPTHGSACAAPSRRATKSVLWFGALVTALVLGSGWWVPWIA